MKCEQCERNVKACYISASKYSIGFYGDQFIVQHGSRTMKCGIFDTQEEAEKALTKYLIQQITYMETALERYRFELKLWAGGK